VVSSTPRPYFTPGKDPVPIVQEAGWASGPVWTGGKSRPTPGFDLRTVQLVAQSLYRLSYPAHCTIMCPTIKVTPNSPTHLQHPMILSGFVRGGNKKLRDVFPFVPWHTECKQNVPMLGLSFNNSRWYTVTALTILLSVLGSTFETKLSFCKYYIVFSVCYTGCNRMNGPDFGRVFFRSNYTDITQNTYIQS
jgi:hypothetical protein